MVVWGRKDESLVVCVCVPSQMMPLSFFFVGEYVCIHTCTTVSRVPFKKSSVDFCGKKLFLVYIYMASSSSEKFVPVPIGTLVNDTLFSRDLEQSEVKAQERKKLHRAKKSDPKYFHSVRISALAAIKMLLHAKQGVDDGIKETGIPVEVMGCLIGYADIATPGVVVVTDCFEVPCKGGPHSAEMDPRTATFMSEKSEELEMTRPKQRICGWYHSHPFDVMTDRHHCWFSDTDVTNQNAWQIGCDNDGDPFLGIVIDPQTSLHKRSLYFGAFRNYPTFLDRSSSKCIPCPDGTVEENDEIRQLKWGAAWRSYYQLRASFFTSESNAKLLSALTSKFGWISDLTSDSDVRKFSEKVSETNQLIDSSTSKDFGKSSSSTYGTMMMLGNSSSSSNRTGFGSSSSNYRKSAKRGSERGGKGKISEKDSEIMKAAKKASEMGCNFSEAQLIRALKSNAFRVE